MASSSSSPSGGGAAASAVATARSAASLLAPPPSSRRLPPPCWTHEETLALIDSYRDKWYELRRGNLRAPHWQDVADGVARRCRGLPAATPKTSVQCRHKIEKLRKRYRADRKRSVALDPSAPPASSWVYFQKMYAMENASASASAPAPAPIRPQSLDDEDDSSSDDDDDEEDPRDALVVVQGTLPNGGGMRLSVPSPGPSSRFLKGGYNAGDGMGMAAEEMRRRLEKKRRREGESESDAVGEMVSALRMLGDGFLRIEEMKMEMMREVEKVRMEMELKHTEMIMESQRRIVEAFAKGLDRGKKRAFVAPKT